MPKLQQLGLTIEHMQAKGYRLPGGLELLDRQRIQAQLDDNATAQLTEIQCLDCVDSTNQAALALLRQGMTRNTAVLAEYQSAGRGRRGRRWFAPYGCNINLTLAWQLPCDPSELAGLSLAIAVAMVRSLQPYQLPPGLQVKWPNDVLWQGRKLAGILIDMMAESHSSTWLIIGIGLNVSSSLHHQSAIDQPWVDLHTIVGQAPSRNALCASLLNAVLACLKDFQQQGFAPFIDEWHQHDISKGKAVTLSNQDQAWHGIAQGVNHRGELLLIDRHNQTHCLPCGDLSLRVTP